ncbi:uncharacterized protein [Salmo salar]|uniref:Tc1-like transposase DDE domain-containing protein n=1 Tax=Salmo salar TaxID=8030 RepID=A0ABM3DU79_SALSA|nr:uncharacterized protein LOC123729872 [Salmo salar]
MVMANNAITLRQIRAAILQDNAIFQNVNSISNSTIDRILKKHQMTMKQIYRVPFERNSDRVKELRYQYVHRIMALEGNETHHILVFVDEAGFNLAKGRRRGRNIVGHRATADVPGQRGGNITMCAAISENGVATHIPSLGPYNTQKLLIFLDRLHFDLIPENERGLVGPHLPQYVIVWDNVNFHRGPLIRAWFTTHPRMVMVFLTLLSSILLRSISPLGGGECMSIGLKIRGPCSMHWTLHVRILQEISVGDGCDMHAVSSLVASQGRIYAVMWTRICGQTDSSVWMARRVRMVVRRGRVGTATSEELLVVKLQLYLQHYRLHIIFIVFCLCVYITVYYAVYIFFLL